MTGADGTDSADALAVLLARLGDHLDAVDRTAAIILQDAVVAWAADVDEMWADGAYQIVRAILETLGEHDITYWRRS